MSYYKLDGFAMRSTTKLNIMFDLLFQESLNESMTDRHQMCVDLFNEIGMGTSDSTYAVYTQEMRRLCEECGVHPSFYINFLEENK